MYRGLTALGAAAVAALGVLVPAVPAEAAPSVAIGRVQYNSPGTDNRSNTSLNAEYVALRNTTRSTINLSRWTLRDRANHVYTFHGNVFLRPGATVFVHTGKGRNTALHRYWGRGSYVWNNDGDTAFLRSPGGAQIDTCTWRAGAGSLHC